MIIEARSDVVYLEGRLVKNLWPTIQAVASLLLRSHSCGIIIDGSRLTECSAEGARTFNDALEYIAHYHARIVVTGLPESAMQIVRQVPGIRSQLPIAASVEEARKSLAFEGSRRAERPSGRSLGDILVPLLGDVSPDTATLLARHLALAEGNKARIHLVYVLEVPRVQPLNAPLPEEEAAASQIMEGAQALLRKEGVNAVTHVSRARDAGDEIVSQAREINANMIVLAYSPGPDSDDQAARVVKTLMNKAPCEVVLNRAAMTVS